MKSRVSCKKVKLYSTLLIMLVVLISGITGAYAAVSAVSARGRLVAETINVKAEASNTFVSDSFSWTFTKAGQQKEVSIKTTNSTEEPLTKYYVVSCSGDTMLPEAVLVYLNGEFIGTLNQVVGMTKIDEYDGVILPLANGTDTFTFELHNAADAGILDGKNVTVTINTFTQSIDYTKYCFVKDEYEFKCAVDDINSGLLDEMPLIVLSNGVTLTKTYTIKNSTKIYLNGYTLSGNTDTFLLEDDDDVSPDALLEVFGKGSFNATINCGTNYDEEGAKTLAWTYARKQLKGGISAGEQVDVFGPYDGYVGTVTCTDTACAYSDGVIEANTELSYTAEETLSIDGEELCFKVVGTVDTLLEATLKHMPADGETITGSLFLPTAVPQENATIFWTSSDSSIMSNSGKLVTVKSTEDQITLVAVIKVNQNVYTRSFTYSVSVNNNEINFYKLVQEISPVVLENVRNETNANKSVVYLPITNNLGTYDYRTSYSTPLEEPTYMWNAFHDIGLEDLSYSMTDEQLNDYFYISLDENGVYLNRTTLNNYGTITVTGDFGNGEVYTSNVTISTIAGSNTQLLEKAFIAIDDEIDDVNILYNMLHTRIQDGMFKENGGFSLKASYELNGSIYQVSYSIPSSAANIIKALKNTTDNTYDFSVNPEYFKSFESTVPILATVTYTDNGTEFINTRTFYVTVPAALHVADFGTVSVFNSVKYQVFKQLPDGEQSGTTGFAVSGSVLTNDLPDYLLLRDVVGDQAYLTLYRANNTYLSQLGYTSASDYAQGAKDLYFCTLPTNNPAATDTVAYNFVQLIEWATGDAVTTAASVVTDTTAFDSVKNTKSNGESYLNESELLVIKSFYCYYTGADEAAWQTLYDSIFNRAPGFVYQNSALMNEVIAQLGSLIEDGSWNCSVFSNKFGGVYTKYLEVLGRYAQTTSKKEEDKAPSAEIYNATYLWNKTTTNPGSSATYILDHNGTYWVRTSGTPNYTSSDYSSDKTTYITEPELFVLKVFWLNAMQSNIQTAFPTTNLNSIEAVLNDQIDFYPGYTRADFANYGQAVINALDACLVVPTYFNSDGIVQLVSGFYTRYSKDNQNYLLTPYGATTVKSFTSVLTTATVKNELGQIKSLAYAVPAVTNLDGVASSLAYFSQLENLYIYGNGNLYAFLSSNGLATTFSRLAVNNHHLETLVLQYVAGANNDFDVSNLKNYAGLRYVDLSNNRGIVDPNQFVTTKRSGYRYFDLSNIGAASAYCEYAVDNIATSACTVYYSNEEGTRVKSTVEYASALADLSDFDAFVTKYLYATNKVYGEDGTASTVYWRIDQGNSVKSLITIAGSYEEMTSVNAMNNRVSPYFYCPSTCTYGTLTFNEGVVYKLSYQNDTLSVQGHWEVAPYQAKNPSTMTFSNPQIASSYVDQVGDEQVTDGGTIFTTTLTQGTEARTIVITLQFKVYTIRYTQGFSTYYYKDSNGTLAGDTSSGNASKFAFLSEQDYTTLKAVLSNIANKTYDENQTFTFGQTVGAGSFYLYCADTERIVTNVVNNTTIGLSAVSAASSPSATSVTLTANGTRWYMDAGSVHFYRLQGRTSNNRTSYTITSTTQYEKSSSYSKDVTVNYGMGTISLGSSGTQEVYRFGYDVIQQQTTRPHTLTQSFDGITEQVYVDVATTIGGVIIPAHSVVRVTYSKTGTATRIDILTVQMVRLWYKATAAADKTYLTATQLNQLNSISYQYTDNGTKNGTVTLTKSNGEITQIVYGLTNGTQSTIQAAAESTAVGITSAYNYTYASTPVIYISHIKEASETNLSVYLDDMQLATQSTLKIRYAGTTGIETVYKEESGNTSTTYTNGRGYTLTVSSGLGSWTDNGTLNQPTGTSMTSILNTANQHFYDNQYGNYYGFYYGFNGTTQYIGNGVVVKKGYVYRIMPNADNTAFTWEEIGQYNRTVGSTSGSDAMAVLKAVATGNAKEGDIFYITTNAGGFFTNGWYKVVLNRQNDTLDLMKFMDINIAISTNYTQFTNTKIVLRTAGDYLGVSGVFTVEISAVIKTDNGDGTYNEYVKTYNLKFVGTIENK